MHEQGKDMEKERWGSFNDNLGRVYVTEFAPT